MKVLAMIKEISDPRMEGKVHHPLSTIIFVALCGILCGCESWDDIRDYLRGKKRFAFSACKSNKWNPIK